ncbi:Uncharacterised protein [Escherichia coli]|uniref:Uncharacterized protein n=1 Tax=Escherichia coli TaxID=562 RepID=A0A377DBN3_ECOLX|nr:Uncharacterised protein [Escherichia coli]
MVFIVTGIGIICADLVKVYQPPRLTKGISKLNWIHS